MSVGLFGGTFDPPHIAHLIIARTALEQLPVEQVIFIPAAKAPHKCNRSGSAPEIRLAMLQLAVETDSRLDVSKVEIERGGISYSIDTIRQIKATLGLNTAECYFLIGSDSLMQLDLWRSPVEILAETRVVVIPRPDFRPEMVRPDYLTQVRFLDCPLLEISSSMIRKRVWQGLPIRWLVPPVIEDFICTHQLYKEI